MSYFAFYVLHPKLYTPCSTLYTLHSTFYTLHFTLLTPHSTLHTLHFTLYTSHSSHFTLHTWRYNHKILTMTIKLMILMLVFCSWSIMNQHRAPATPSVLSTHSSSVLQMHCLFCLLSSIQQAFLGSFAYESSNMQK